MKELYIVEEQIKALNQLEREDMDSFIGIHPGGGLQLDEPMEGNFGQRYAQQFVDSLPSDNGSFLDEPVPHDPPCRLELDPESKEFKSKFKNQSRMPQVTEQKIHSGVVSVLAPDNEPSSCNRNFVKLLCK